VRGRLHIDSLLKSTVYTFLLLIPKFEAGLIRAALLHLLACFFICALLLFVVAYGSEVYELLQGAFAAFTDFLIGLSTGTQIPPRSPGDAPAPLERSTSALFQRPPPLLA
jgi:hypothetical protein